MNADLAGWAEDEIFDELAMEDDNPAYHCNMGLLAERLATLWREVAELRAKLDAGKRPAER